MKRMFSKDDRFEIEPESSTFKHQADKQLYLFPPQHTKTPKILANFVTNNPTIDSEE